MVEESWRRKKKKQQTAQAKSEACATGKTQTTAEVVNSIIGEVHDVQEETSPCKEITCCASAKTWTTNAVADLWALVAVELRDGEDTKANVVAALKLELAFAGLVRSIEENWEESQLCAHIVMDKPSEAARAVERLNRVGNLSKVGGGGELRAFWGAEPPAKLWAGEDLVNRRSAYILVHCKEHLINNGGEVAAEKLDKPRKKKGNLVTQGMDMDIIHQSLGEHFVNTIDRTQSIVEPQGCRVERENHFIDTVRLRFRHCGTIDFIDTLDMRNNSSGDEKWLLIHFSRTSEAIKACEDWNERGMCIQSRCTFVCVQYLGHLIDPNLPVADGIPPCATGERPLGASSVVSSPKSRTDSYSSMSPNARPNSSPSLKLRIHSVHAQEQIDLNGSSSDTDERDRDLSVSSLNKRTRSSSPELIHVQQLIPATSDSTPTACIRSTLQSKRTKGSQQTTVEECTSDDSAVDLSTNATVPKKEADTETLRHPLAKVVIQHSLPLEDLKRMAPCLQNLPLNVVRHDQTGTNLVSSIDCADLQDAAKLVDMLNKIDGALLSGESIVATIAGDEPAEQGESTRKRRTEQSESQTEHRVRTKLEDLSTSVALEQLNLQGPNELDSSGGDGENHADQESELQRNANATITGSSKRTGFPATQVQPPVSKRAANLAEVRRQAELELANEIKKGSEEKEDGEVKTQTTRQPAEDNADSLADNFQSAVGFSSSSYLRTTPELQPAQVQTVSVSPHTIQVVDRQMHQFQLHPSGHAQSDMQPPPFHYFQQYPQQQPQQAQTQQPHHQMLPPAAFYPQQLYQQGPPPPPSHGMHWSQFVGFHPPSAQVSGMPHLPGPPPAPAPPHHTFIQPQIQQPQLQHQPISMYEQQLSRTPTPASSRQELTRKKPHSGNSGRNDEEEDVEEDEESAPLETSRLYVTFSKPLPEDALWQRFSDVAPGLEYVSRPREKCFVFVKYSSEAAAKLAMIRLNGKDLLGQTLRISIAQPPRTASSSCRKRQRTADLEKRLTFKK